jgi:hypothetical protein
MGEAVKQGEVLFLRVGEAAELLFCGLSCPRAEIDSRPRGLPVVLAEVPTNHPHAFDRRFVDGRGQSADLAPRLKHGQYLRETITLPLLVDFPLKMVTSGPRWG